MSKTLKYYNIIFRIVSPLAVGSGENANTDKDIILDSRGVPVIPASAVAGVFRHFLGAEGPDERFGYIAGKKSVESKIRFYDAQLISDNYFTTVRDSVALEEKVGKDGAKFDLEAVETGVDYGYYQCIMRCKCWCAAHRVKDIKRIRTTQGDITEKGGVLASRRQVKVA